MLSKKTLKNYEFETNEDYFNYIIESKTNGQFSQVKELIKKLSKPQRKEFLFYLGNMNIKTGFYVNIILSI